MHVFVVGSSVIDIFLDIDPNFSKIDDKTVSFKLGDKVPAELKTMTLGGNGANVSVGLTRLEIPTSFYTYLGEDILSREISDGLTSEGVDLVAARGEQKSASLSIIFGFERDRVIFSHHEIRDYSFNCMRKDFDFMYLTSIGEHWTHAYEQI